MNLPPVVGVAPTLPAGAALALVVSLLPCLLPGLAAALAADPSDPAAPVPPVAYRSAFEGYERWRDGPRTSWRDANDMVGRMGGHMGHVEETTPPAPQAEGTAAPAARPGGGQHHHHKP